MSISLQSQNASNHAASLPPQWGPRVLVTHPRVAAFEVSVDGGGQEPACEGCCGIWQERYGDELAAKAVTCSEHKIDIYFSISLKWMDNWKGVRIHKQINKIKLKRSWKRQT